MSRETSAVSVSWALRASSQGQVSPPVHAHLCPCNAGRTGTSQSPGCIGIDARGFPPTAEAWSTKLVLPTVVHNRSGSVSKDMTGHWQCICSRSLHIDRRIVQERARVHVACVTLAGSRIRYFTRACHMCKHAATGCSRDRMRDSMHDGGCNVGRCAGCDGDGVMEALRAMASASGGRVQTGVRHGSR